MGNADGRAIGLDQWLRNPDNFQEHQWREFRELRQSRLKTARAWALKEQAMLLWDYVSEAWAKKHFAWWHRWATRSRLKPMAVTSEDAQSTPTEHLDLPEARHRQRRQ